MRFLYAYKTADGIRHEDAIDASSRDEAFAALRVKGIRPIKVIEVQGGSHRRWLMASVLLTVASAALLTVDVTRARMRDDHQRAAGGRGDPESGLVAKPRARKQLPPELFDPAALEKAFAHPSERFFSRFARPGLIVAPVDPAESSALAEDFIDSLQDDIFLDPGETPAVSELKRIVAGIKREARMLADSGWSFAEIAEYFILQQQREAVDLKQILEADISEEEKSRRLRALGLR